MINKDLLKRVSLICKTSPGYRSPAEISFLVDVTRDIKLFKDLNHKQGATAHELCCQHLLFESMAASSYVFRYGDLGTKFYIVVSGSVGIQIPINSSGQVEFTEIMTVTPGSSFGELALESSKPRSGSAYCKSESSFLVLLKKDYSNLVQKLVSDKKNEMIKFLQDLPVFNRINKHVLARLLYNIKELAYNKGNFIFNEGDLAKEIFIVKEGECKLSKKVKIMGSDGIRHTARKRMCTAKKVGKGSMIGEDDVFAKEPHSYSCMCNTNVVVYVIPAADFFIRITAEQPLRYLQNISEEKKEFFKNWSETRQKLDGMLVREKTVPNLTSSGKVLERLINIEKISHLVSERKKIYSRATPSVNDDLASRRDVNRHKKTSSMDNILIGQSSRNIQTAQVFSKFLDSERVKNSDCFDSSSVACGRRLLHSRNCSKIQISSWLK